MESYPYPPIVVLFKNVYVIIKDMNFSKKLVLAYTSIVIIPTLILLIIILVTVRTNQYIKLRENCEEVATENQATIEKNINKFNLLEQMIGGNEKLKFFFTIPERCDEGEVIDTMISESKMIERTLGVMPEIYGLRVFANNENVPERFPIFMKSARTNLEDLKKWEYNYSADYLGNLGQLKFESVCTTRPIYKSDRLIGHLQIAMKMSDFFPFLYTRHNEYQTDYVFEENIDKETGLSDFVRITNSYIDDIQGDIDAKVLKKFVTTFNASDSEIKKKSGHLVVNSKLGDTYVSWRRIKDMNIIVMHASSSREVFETVLKIEALMFSIIVTLVFLLFILVKCMTKKLMSGVYSLMEGMKRVREGDLDVTISADVKGEVGEAQQTFNSMTKTLNFQINLIKQEQQLIADTEMKAMQNQINAHFLYNVLETIKMQAVIADQEDIVESVTVLGNLMRYCLRWRIHIVTLNQEVDYIRAYIYLLNLRNDYEISLETEIPAELENLKIPKMILQPIVENAFNYAIEPLGENSSIKVYAEEDEKNKDKVWLCVQDYGPGISPENIEKINSYLKNETYERDSKGNIGIKNIQQRLTMMCGKDYRVQIISELGKGTLIKIPVSRRISEKVVGV